MIDALTKHNSIFPTMNSAGLVIDCKISFHLLVWGYEQRQGRVCFIPINTYQLFVQAS
uniref:Uncharacterized protein n=1 Tax=Octopus bimaculoides TaxID=37653 RepID=A0A0L8FSN6_OCTBM